jgi:hypothetical protein
MEANPSGHMVWGMGLWLLAAGIAGLKPTRGMDVCLLWDKPKVGNRNHIEMNRKFMHVLD